MSDEAPKVKYGDGEIHYSEHNEKWEAYIKDESIGSRCTLADARKLIDKHGEEEKTFKRHTALMCGSRFDREEGWLTVTVTSYPETTWGGPKAWITKPSKRREQKELSYLREDNKKNHDLIAKVGEVDKQIKALEVKKEALLESMDDYKKRNQDETTKP